MTQGAVARRGLVLACLALAATAAAAAERRVVPHGRLETLGGYPVVSVDGTPEQMGTAYGTLLAPLIQRVVKAVITDGVASDPEARTNLLAGSQVMARFQPRDYIAELKAIAAAARVPYDDLLLLQYFGDVRRCITGTGRSMFCTSFAVLPPLARGRRCIVGRNFDYFDEGVGEYASLLAYYRPRGRIPFVTVTWAGVVNGWTLLNERGIAVSNNTAFGARANSLEGISTCFMLRVVAERAATVKEGVALVRKGPRACGTNMLIASGTPPDGVIIEFDHAKLAVRRPDKGFVGAANSYFTLYQEGWGDLDPYWGRIGTARDMALKHRGRVDLSCNLAGAEGVPIESMNLHSVLLDATALRLRIAMGKIPACKLPYRAFRLTKTGLVAELRGNQPPAQAKETPNERP